MTIRFSLNGNLDSKIVFLKCSMNHLFLGKVQIILPYLRIIKRNNI